MEIAVCDPDPVLSADAVRRRAAGRRRAAAAARTSEPLGWASAEVGEDPSGDGVAVEVWSRAIVDGKPADSNPYFHWVFPYVKTRLSGDRVIENGLLANTYEGFGVGNTAFGEGPDSDHGGRTPSGAGPRSPTVRTCTPAAADGSRTSSRGLCDWSTGTAGAGRRHRGHAGRTTPTRRSSTDDAVVLTDLVGRRVRDHRPTT